MERRGLFVGIGIDAYDSHEPLRHAVAEVNAVAEVLGTDFAGEPLLDADLAQNVFGKLIWLGVSSRDFGRL